MFKQNCNFLQSSPSSSAFQMSLACHAIHYQRLSIPKRPLDPPGSQKSGRNPRRPAGGCVVCLPFGRKHIRTAPVLLNAKLARFFPKVILIREEDNLGTGGSLDGAD